LSCVGRDLRKNEPRQPSVLLRELLDHLDQYFATPTDDKKLSDAITRVHPLQPFSPARFSLKVARSALLSLPLPLGEGRGEGSGHGEQLPLPPGEGRGEGDNQPDPRSFDAHWCRIAHAVQQSAGRPADTGSDWPSAALPPVPEAMHDVTLAQLERFLAHPLRWFVQTRLGVYLRETELEPDEEPFDLDHLAAWALKTRLIEDRLADRPASAARLAAEGLLPHGAFAELALASEQAALAPLDEALAPYAGQRPSSLQLDLALTPDGDGPRRLTGQVSGLYPGLGLLRWRATKTLRGEHRLKLWLAHLARWAVVDAARIQDPEPSVLLGLDPAASLILRRPLRQADARAKLGELVALYWQGLHRPLPIFPKASAAFAEAWQADPDKAMNAARKAWQGNDYNNIRGDVDDDYIRLLLRDVPGDPLAHPDFARLAIELYRPLLAAEGDHA
jgi:exodeoxyribonuclease V gamma subunit